MMAKTRLLFLSLLLLFGCNNYGLLDKLENPGGGSNLAGSPSSPPPTYRIFVTFGSFPGAMVWDPANNPPISIVRADLNCQTDSNKPGGTATWKAMLVDGGTRRACTSANCSTSGNGEHNDWVLKPNATYVRPDGTLIGSTNDKALLVFPLSNSIGIGSFLPWTGLNTDWTSDTSNNCGGWTIDDAGYGSVGEAGAATAAAIRYNLTPLGPCASGKPLYCVEQ
jgi:hypothetical protein